MDPVVCSGESFFCGGIILTLALLPAATAATGEALPFVVRMSGVVVGVGRCGLRT